MSHEFAKDIANVSLNRLLEGMLKHAERYQDLIKDNVDEPNFEVDCQWDKPMLLSINGDLYEIDFSLRGLKRSIQQLEAEEMKKDKKDRRVYKSGTRVGQAKVTGTGSSYFTKEILVNLPITRILHNHQACGIFMEVRYYK